MYEKAYGLPGDPNKPEHWDLGEVLLNQIVVGKKRIIDTDAIIRAQEWRYDMEQRRLKRGLREAYMKDDEKAAAIWEKALEVLEEAKGKVMGYIGGE